MAPGNKSALQAGHSLPLRADGGAVPVPGLEGGRDAGRTAATGTADDGRGTGGTGVLA